MKLWTLVENATCREDLAAEHGLSLYIEACDKKILFDAGGSGAFAENAEKMGIDLTAVDLAILSHGHNDHGGGLMRFLDLNKTAPVYLNPWAFDPHFNAEDKNIGIDPALKETGMLRFVDDTCSIGPGLTLFSCKDRYLSRPIDTAGLTAVRNGSLQPEDFRHEQYLLIEEDGKKVLISGCSHRGILNIMERFRPDILVGGFHFMKMDPASAALTEATQILGEYPTTYYTGHCTGLAQFAAMKQLLGDQLHYLSTGSTLCL